MKKIIASGALRKFLDARARGAEPEQLKALQLAALAELPRARSRAPAADFRRGVLLDFDAARTRIAQSWDSAAQD
jgi:hypothetical protein